MGDEIQEGKDPQNRTHPGKPRGALGELGDSRNTTAYELSHSTRPPPRKHTGPVTPPCPCSWVHFTLCLYRMQKWFQNSSQGQAEDVTQGRRSQKTVTSDKQALSGTPAAKAQPCFHSSFSPEFLTQEPQSPRGVKILPCFNPSKLLIPV